MRILFLGDVFGPPGRRAVETRLRDLRDELEIDVCIVNGENAADGIGLTAKLAQKLLDAGADAITLGNHVWRQRDLVPFLDESDRIVRPANLGGPGTPGKGLTVVPAARRDAGRGAEPPGPALPRGRTPSVRRSWTSWSPRRASSSPVIVVDFHAEATSEKIALARVLDGRVTAVLGTHTHVQTNDARVLPGGTAAITDAGMTGPHDSVIGVKAELAIQRMKTGRPVRFHPAEGDVRIEGVVVECGADGRATSCEPVRVFVG